MNDPVEEAIIGEDIEAEVTQMRNALNTGYNSRQRVHFAEARTLRCPRRRRDRLLHVC